MEYVSAYFWQQEEEERTALVLQQLFYGRKKLPVLFACVCTSDKEMENIYANKGDVGNLAAYFNERLAAWFWQEGRKRCVKRNGANISLMENNLCITIQAIEREIREYAMQKLGREFWKMSFAGIIAVGEYFLSFGQGKCRICLLNTRFDRPNAEWLWNGEELVIESGIMQRRIGLLLATEDFYKIPGEQQLQECLAVKELAWTKGLQRRLKELGERSEEKGGRQMGAVLMLTC